MSILDIATDGNGMWSCLCSKRWGSEMNRLWGSSSLGWEAVLSIALGYAGPPARVAPQADVFPLSSL